MFSAYSSNNYILNEVVLSLQTLPLHADTWCCGTEIGDGYAKWQISILCMETKHSHDSMHTWYLRREGKPCQNLWLPLS